MTLADHVHVARRFQRAVRIDSDSDDLAAIEGFVCTKSSRDVLLAMARQVKGVGQGAFTWTGPYGSGKSSLAAVLVGLLSSKKVISKAAAEIVGQETAQQFYEAMPQKSRGWITVPVVGRRENPIQAIGDALVLGGHVKRQTRAWTESKLLSSLTSLASDRPKSSGGLLLVVDEMGKFLEGAARNDEDVYVFQQIAEAASRSQGRLIFVGILHQAFEDYANRLSREQRDEWTKIQGRFVDLPVNVAGEEQLSLLSRAIEAEDVDAKVSKVASSIAEAIRAQRPAASEHLEETLIGCWPLHPVVACLLGPISRRRFGQNQRSIFGFLNSAEPQGLQDFLRHATFDDLYTPDRLWEYLRFNLEPSILASTDGHKWSLAVEALQRCEAVGGDRDHLTILKTVALIDQFKERSGLIASKDVIAACCGHMTKKQLTDTIQQLEKWSLVIFRKFAGDFAIYAGSDFEIDAAIDAAYGEIEGPDLAALKSYADIQPILAKRHYHKTGVLRWFDVDIAAISDLLEVASGFHPKDGTIGQFILALPTAGETDEACHKVAREAARLGEDWDIIVGVSPRTRSITDLARELIALQFVAEHSQELAGDPVARREVTARTASVQEKLEGELEKAFDNADWYRRRHQPKRLSQAEVNSLASDMADERFNQSPTIHNELLNRIKPSSNAIAAQNFLLRRMVMSEGEPRLGIDGFPAEGGLFASMLEATGLYRKKGEQVVFQSPPKGARDVGNLTPLWEAAVSYLKESQDRSVSVSEIYSLWREAPFGVRDGMMPVLAVAFMLSQRQHLAFYRQGIFQGRLKDLDVDYLAKDASDIQLRWMDLSEFSRRLLSDLAEIVRELDDQNRLADLTPIDVARGLIAIYTNLPDWTLKTLRLSQNAVQVRQLFKNANDPNKFLFDDIPERFTGDAAPASEEGIRRICGAVREGLLELQQAYPTMLRRLRDSTLIELQVPSVLPRSLAELRLRAENVKQLSGDFRLEAFVNRLVDFEGSDQQVAELVSLALNKPPKSWVDPDIDKAAIELADLAQKFVRAEAFARIKGRKDKRQAMAVIVGINGRPTPLSGEFDVTDRDRGDIEALVEQIEEALESGDHHRRNIVLAALAELSARYLSVGDGDREGDLLSQAGLFDQ